MTRTLEASADLLMGGAAPDLAALHAARMTHRQALDRWAETALAEARIRRRSWTACRQTMRCGSCRIWRLPPPADAVIVTGGQVESRA